MNKLRLKPLFSGSGGNCTYIEGGGTKILIDAGVSTRRIERALTEVGSTLSEIDAVFITHEHHDHIAALPVLTGRCAAPVHMTELSFECADLEFSAQTHPTCFTEEVGALTVRSFPLSHDSACCVGYTVSLGGHRVGVMTDTGYITDEAVASLVGCERVLLESNHDVGMLRHGPYPKYLQNRILSERGHLSNEECAGFCAFLAARGTRDIYLGHLSRENNTPDCALSCTARLLEGEGVRIRCAPEAVV